MSGLRNARRRAPADRDIGRPASGARVYFVENHDLPIVDVSVEFPAGSGRDTRDSSGLAALTLGMLPLWRATVSTEEDREPSRRCRGATSGRLRLDRAGMTLRTLSSAAERDGDAGGIGEGPAVADVSRRRPGTGEVRVVAGLQEADTKPETIAGRTFAPPVYGDHPYAMRCLRRE